MNAASEVASLLRARRSTLNLTPEDRVLIVGGYGVRNVGDEAILAGLLGQLPAIARTRVVSRSPRETTAMHGVAAVSPIAALPALLRSDVMVVGGGGLFSADTGPFGRFIPTLTRLALALRVRVAYHGVGVYHSTPAWLLRSLVGLAPRLESFSVRDAASVQTLNEAGLDIQQIADLSEALAPGDEREARLLLSSAGLDPDRPTVALCLTSLNQPLERFLESAVPDLLAVLPDVQFCFLPMSQHPTNPQHDDLNLGSRLAARSPRLKLIEGVHQPALVLALYRHFAAAVCVRFHSYLFAARSGVPIVALPYAEKCESWLAENQLAGIARDGYTLIEAVRSAIGSEITAPLRAAV